ncbi:MAG TPA: Hsp20/alpha crystallin family protein [Candidatus Cottocaccamicrobium excrementipullorum]|nr:Hsp20/alpha crystallin family protein [Candidatus Cottocaccamicrobium excrementipullorum]
MLMPSIFGENLLDDFFDDSFGYYPAAGSAALMETDVKDTDHGYEITMNLPGVKKEDIKAELKDGYLTITANSNSNKDEKDEKGRYIRRERYSGSCSRSFYVGDQVTEGDVKAKFENGTLTLNLPKKEDKSETENKKYIAIEG